MNNDKELKELVKKICFEGVRYNDMGNWSAPITNDPLTPELCAVIDELVAHIKLNY